MQAVAVTKKPALHGQEIYQTGKFRIQQELMP